MAWLELVWPSRELLMVAQDMVLVVPSLLLLLLHLLN